MHTHPCLRCGLALPLTPRRAHAHTYALTGDEDGICGCSAGEEFVSSTRPYCCTGGDVLAERITYTGGVMDFYMECCPDPDEDWICDCSNGYSVGLNDRNEQICACYSPRIERDGRLALKALGGGSEELFAWHQLTVYSSNGPLAGVMEQFGSVNLGADSPEAVRKLGVEVGAKASVPKQIRGLLGSRISGRALDDRVGCAILLAAINELEADQNLPVWLVFSVREETGLIGAQAIAEQTSPKWVYAIDSFVTSDSPLEERRFAFTPLGEGAVIRGVDNSSLTPAAEVERVLALAKKLNIPLRPGVTAGGNDGSRFIMKGAANIPLSFPLRYSHTAVETADLRDIEALYEIVQALIRSESDN